MITENLEQVRKNIEEACRAVNRDPGESTAPVRYSLAYDRTSAEK